MHDRRISRSRNGQQQDGGANATNQATAQFGDRRTGSEEMKKQFPNYRKLDGSFNNCTGKKGLPEGLNASQWDNVHRIKGKLLNCPEGQVGNEEWEKLVDPAPPEEHNKRRLQNLWS